METKTNNKDKDDIILCQPFDDGGKVSDVMQNSIENLDIRSLIVLVRGWQVMLDRDLAVLYGVSTKALNQAVKRNVERFPGDFMFQLTKEECSRSQIVTLNGARGKNLKYLPYAFTENGIAMLSSVLRSESAVSVNIKIMRTFTSMRHNDEWYVPLSRRLELIERHQLELSLRQSESENKIVEVLQRLDSGQLSPSQGVFCDGQIFDAYTFVADLIRSARKRIVLVDNYVDDSVLKMFTKRSVGVEVSILTRRISEAFNLDLERHNRQYPPVEVGTTDRFHDRFLIIDGAVYHLGASLKDLGKKLFAFSKLELDAEWLLKGGGRM